MSHIKSIVHIELLSPLKHQYIESLSGPLDGMWLTGFLPSSAHYGLYDGDQLAGYFCINDQDYLLQFYLDEQHKHLAASVFQLILNEESLPKKNNWRPCQHFGNRVFIAVF